ncbi:importin-4 [Ixodes scapularis]|uniref:importin-4 n=1 Tax=Ixodes scapularis TaxID=6945 RepID=UPI001C3879C6|nr:importin-4 [Ixodes scapularis]
MAASLENVLSRLLIPDNAVIMQATHELRELYKDPNIAQYLYATLCMAQIPQVRQYSAVLLRKKICKTKAWKQLSEEPKTALKNNLLQLLTSEKEKPVVQAIGQLVAVIAKHEWQQSRQWAELQQFMNVLTQSKDLEQCRLGFHIVGVVASVAPEVLKPHLVPLLALFGGCLQTCADQQLCLDVVKAMSSLVCCLGSEHAPSFNALIPLAMEFIKRLIEVDQDKAMDAMELFDELLDSEVAILLPHIKPLIKLCLDVASDTKRDSALRVRCLCLISWMVNVKKKTIVKHKLIPELLDILFPIMAEVTDNDLDADEDDDEDDDLSQTPSASAAQLVDTMALHLPPEKLIPPLSQHVEKYLTSDNPLHKKAAYLAMAVIAEGCSEAIREKYLQTFLQVICQGIGHENPHVKNAALFALGEFADYLQPDINKFAGDVMPILLVQLTQMAQQMGQLGKNVPNLSKTFYALETFCENLEEGLVPYLPTLMEQILLFLTLPSHRAKELAISCVGAAANATKEAMLPYFPRIIEHLKGYLTEHQSEQDSILRTQALDTLGCLAKTIGEVHFRPMAPECAQLGLRLLEAVDDPDLRRSTYGLFASLSLVLKADMSPYMGPLLEHMFTSLQSTEGVVTSAGDGGFPLFDELEDSDDEDAAIHSGGDGEDSDDDELKGCSVENAYLEEKEDTSLALGQMAENMGPAFVPFLDNCFTQLLLVADHPSPDVQKAVLSSLAKLTVVLAQFAASGCNVCCLVAVSDVQKAVSILMPKLIEVCQTEPERELVIGALETLAVLVKELKSVAVEDPKHVEHIVSLVRSAFNHKLPSQDCDSDGEEAEDEEAEYDGLLVQVAGDLVPALAQALPPERFLPHLGQLVPLFTGKLKERSSRSDRSYAVGTLAEVAQHLNRDALAPFCQPLLAVFLGCMRDADAEVRSNAVFGLGALAESAGDALVSEYPALLAALSSMLSKESSRQAKDNICGAVARLILTSVNAVPMAEVFPVLLQHLPLEEDLEENVTLFRCICRLYELRHEQFLKNLPQILRLVLGVIKTNQVTPDTRTSLVQLIKSTSSEIPSEVQAVLQTFPPDEQELFNAILASP